ncbi:MAG TPA: glycosyltransferase family A protein [Allosphingosinicella sp.]|nr:glycosyltransferase family A protein [Allosphingosinicella sp.]
MAAQPLVSVIVAARDADATLAAALQSALAQSHRRFEIIVVDDGSTDATAEIAREFARRDKRVRLMQGRGAGVSAARNVALAVASGRYVAPLDADDLWHPAKLERQVAAAEGAAEPPGFVYCWLRHIDGEGRVTGSGPRDDFHGCIAHRHLYKCAGAAGGTALIRRDAMTAIGGYDERLDRCEDFFLQLRIASRHPVTVVPEYLLGYRGVPGSLSRDRDTVLRNWRLLRMLSRQSCPGITHRFDRWMYARQFYQAAEARLVARAWLSGFGLLLKAALRDPPWTFGSAWLRLSSMLDRRPAPVPGPAFLAIDPRERLGPEPMTERAAAFWLRWLDTKRMAKLARRDAAYASRSFPRRRCG